MGLHLRRRPRRGRRRAARPAWRQGRLSCRDVAVGSPRPARAHHLVRGLRSLLPGGQDAAQGVAADGERGARRRRQGRRRALRRCRQSAARVGALGLARLDARHDGHGAQSRPQRPDRRGTGAPLLGPQICLRHLSPLHSDVWRRGARHRPRSVRGGARELQKSQWLRNGQRAQGRALGGGDRPLQGAGRAGAWPALPAGSARAALGRDRRRVRLLAQRARHRLSAAARHSRRLGHGGHGAGHGVRQYGRAQRHRRRVHAQPVHRRERALRRVPGECPRRGRGRGAAYAAISDRGCAGSNRRQARPRSRG